MTKLIIIAISILIVLLIYFVYKFKYFKTQLMKSFQQMGIPYEIANDIYFHNSDQINKLQQSGLEANEIVMKILSQNPDIALKALEFKLLNSIVPLSANEIEKIKDWAGSMNKIDGVKFIHSDVGPFYQLKGDAFIMADISKELFERLWHLMEMDTENPQSAYHDARKSSELSANISISKLNIDGDIYHANLLVLFNDKNNNGKQVEIGATAKNSLNELFDNIKSLFLNETKWHNTTQEALSDIGKN